MKRILRWECLLGYSCLFIQKKNNGGQNESLQFSQEKLRSRQLMRTIDLYEFYQCGCNSPLKRLSRESSFTVLCFRCLASLDWGRCIYGDSWKYYHEKAYPYLQAFPNVMDDMINYQDETCINFDPAHLLALTAGHAAMRRAVGALLEQVG